MIDAIKKQAESCAYAYNYNYTTEPAEELAELLCNLSDGAFDKVAYVNGGKHCSFPLKLRTNLTILIIVGSEAMEATMKLSRQYFREIGQHDRTQFISRELSCTRSRHLLPLPFQASMFTEGP